MTEEGLFSNADDLDSENQGRDDLGEFLDSEENEKNQKLAQAKVNRNKKQKV
jgi:hypothetical protein